MQGHATSKTEGENTPGFPLNLPRFQTLICKKRLVVPHFPVIVANEGWQGYPSLKMVKNPGGDYCWTAQNMPNKYMHLLYDVPAPRKIAPKKPLRVADLTQWVLKDITQKSLKTPPLSKATLSLELIRKLSKWPCTRFKVHFTDLHLK